MSRAAAFAARNAVETALRMRMAAGRLFDLVLFSS
jgi:hypothetical protein